MFNELKDENSAKMCEKNQISCDDKTKTSSFMDYLHMQG